MNRKIFIFFLLSLSGVLTLFAGTKWADASHEEKWLQDPDFYSPQYETYEELPNGTLLLFKMPSDEFQGAVVTGPSGMSRRKYIPLDLVRLLSVDGHFFQGLGERQPDGNYLPVYGLMDNEWSVFYNYDINFNVLPLPKKLSGTWYTPDIDLMLGDPDEKWKSDHPGRKSLYTTTSCFEVDGKYEGDIYREASRGYITFGSKPQYIFDDLWGCRVPREEVSSAVVGEGRNRSLKQYFSGGYIAEIDGHRTYRVTYDWDAENGKLKIKFGPKLKANYEIELHNYEGFGVSDYDQNDFNNMSPCGRYIRQAVPKWLAQSPAPVWGEVEVDVIAVTDRFMVVGGKYYKNGNYFFEVWCDKSYNSFLLSNYISLLSNNRRAGIVESLMEKRPSVRKRIEREAMRAQAYNLVRDTCGNYMADVLKYYSKCWADFKKAQAKNGNKNPQLADAKNKIDSNTKIYVRVEYPSEKFGIDPKQKCASLQQAILDDDALLSTIVEATDFAPYKFTENSVELLIATNAGVKKLTLPLKFNPLIPLPMRITSVFQLDGEPSLSDVSEILAEVNNAQAALNSLAPTTLNTLKSEYPKELKALKKAPRSVKEISAAARAAITLQLYLNPPRE